MVDARGVLRPGALDAPPREACFTVFAQRSDARLELAVWERHAAQFFDTKLGLTAEKRYDGGYPDCDAARVVVAPPSQSPGTRFAFARPRTDDDLAAAEEADIRAGSPGMALLARRCGMVWMVALEEADDALALRLSAIVASVVLGPILSPDQGELFGVRTAREKLEKLAAPSPYRSKA